MKKISAFSLLVPILYSNALHARPILTCYTDVVPLPAPSGGAYADWYDKYEGQMSGAIFNFGTDPDSGLPTDCFGHDMNKGSDSICANINGPKSNSYYVKGGKEWITKVNGVYEAFRSDGLYYKLELKEPYQLFRRWEGKEQLFTVCEVE